mgnify:CR=1 FL=1
MQGLQELGWTVGRNLRIDYRWSAGDAARIRKDAQRNWSRCVRTSSWLLSAPPRSSLQQADPHRADRVRHKASIRSAPATSTAWRGRAATPPASFSSNTAWLGSGWSCSKQIAPGVTRVAVLRESRASCRDRTVGRDPGRGAVVRRGVEPDQLARRERDRARRHGIRALAEWRPDRDGERGIADSSRLDHRACGATSSCPRSTAYRVFVTRRRLDLLWA